MPPEPAEPVDYDTLRRFVVATPHARRFAPPACRTTWLEKLLDRAYLAIRRFRTRAAL